MDSTYWTRASSTYRPHEFYLAVLHPRCANISWPKWLPESQGQANQEALMGRLKEQDVYPAVEGITPDVSILLLDRPSCSLATGLPHFLKHTVLSFSLATNYCTKHNCCTSLTASWHRLSVADYRLHGNQIPTRRLYRPASRQIALCPTHISRLNVEPRF